MPSPICHACLSFYHPILNPDCIRRNVRMAFLCSLFLRSTLLSLRSSVYDVLEKLDPKSN